MSTRAAINVDAELKSETIAGFLRVIFPDGRGYADIRSFRALRDRPGIHDERVSVIDVELISRMADEFTAKDLDVYVGVASRRTKENGTTANCATLAALFSDIDFKDYGGDEAAARQQLDAFPIPPSIIIRSGAGLQCYWLLTELLDLQNDGSAGAKTLLRRLARAVGGDLKAAEPAHILRLPGTKNFKYDPPRDVVIETFRNERVPLSSIEAVIALYPDAMLIADQIDDPKTDLTPIEHGLDVPTRVKLARSWLATQAPAVERQGGDTRTYQICCDVAVGHDLTADDAFEALKEWNARCTPPWSKHDLRKKIHNAIRYANGQRGERLIEFPNTESGDAECFALIYGDSVRFDHRRTCWIRLEEGSGIWLPDNVAQLVELTKGVIRERRRRANEIPEKDKRDRAWTWAMRGESRSRLANMAALAQSVPPIADAGDRWDRDPWLLGCTNGVVDLRTGRLRRGRPEDYVSFSTGVVYDPDARSELWEKTLHEIFPHDGLVDFMQRALGYTITGDTRLDKWFLGHGDGRNGKGVIYGAVRGAIGDYALELPASVFDLHGQNAYDLANLPGRRFVTSSESGNAIRLNHDLLKKLTGGDRQRAANKYEKSFEFDPMCKLWLACNHKPQVTDDSAGFWARVIVIPFTVSFLGREDVTLRPTLSDRNGDHVRAVLSWLVRGGLLAVKDGLGTLPAVVRDATEQYRNESGPLADFLSSECVIHSNAKAKADALRQRYVGWCERTHVRYPLGARQFGEALKARFDSKHTKEGTFYFGVGVSGTQQEPPCPF